eukprot:maker-scaffold1121_size61474-snap-gene-0.20 protein:Tk07068 transcript:maker-scaffold1121_size61474-snap-gene-0.20-mRNA-1 annotation:"peripheral-type benzodiazepine receptor-associated protein 1-like isoform x1"
MDQSLSDDYLLDHDSDPFRASKGFDLDDVVGYSSMDLKDAKHKSDVNDTMTDSWNNNTMFRGKDLVTSSDASHNPLSPVMLDMPYGKLKSADEDSNINSPFSSPLLGQLGLGLVDDMPLNLGYETVDYMPQYTSCDELDMFDTLVASDLVLENKVDMLDIPGKGRCSVFLARYSYDPFNQSLNDNPEYELPLSSGDYVLVWSEGDDDGFLEAELLDGRRGLVPSNFVERLCGDDLMEFHRCVVLAQEMVPEDYSTCVPLNLPCDNTGTPKFNAAPIYDEESHLLNATYYSPDAEEDYMAPRPPEIIEPVNNESTITDNHTSGVPAPRHLTLERQLNKSILISWLPPENNYYSIEMYHVYVDGFLRTTVKATDKTKALVEGVENNKVKESRELAPMHVFDTLQYIKLFQPHRISVRSVLVNRKTSKDAACTMIIGKDAPLGPSCVKASNVTSTSAVISWLPSNSNFQHTVCINNVEIRTVKPGVFKHTITGLSPNTVYKVTVRAKNIKASPYVDEKSLSKLLEKLSAHTDFRTLNKALPDPPLDVRVDGGPQDGTILVTWIPVSSSHHDHFTPVTGYAVFADGKRVTDVDSPTSDHALIDLGCIGHFHPKVITVRSKSRDLLSNDSTAVPIIANKHVKKNGKTNFDNRSRHGQSSIVTRGARRYNKAMRDHTGQLVFDQDEENMSEKEIGGYRRDSSRIFVALFDYDPPTMSPNPEACDDELYFREGQLIKILGEKDSDGFYWGECNGRSGFVPCNMVSEVQVEDDRYLKEVVSSHKQDMRRRTNRQAGSKDRWRDMYSSDTVRKMIALYDYDPQELSPNVDAEVELSFKTGDIIYVYGEMDDDGFYLAELRGQRGLVPSNFLTDAANSSYQGKNLGAAHGPPPPPREIKPKEVTPPTKPTSVFGQVMGSLVGHATPSAPKPQPTPTAPPIVSQAPALAPKKLNNSVDLDKIPGLDNDYMAPRPAVTPTRQQQPLPGSNMQKPLHTGLGGAPAGQAQQHQQQPQEGGLLGGLTSGISGLTSSTAGKLGDLAGSATNAGGGILNSGKGLFKKFGF